MKFNDDITMSIASTVKDVLEGKAPKEVKEMDPKKHVSKNGNKFDVVNNNGKVVKSFDNEDAANKYATDNHDDLMKEGPDQPNKPSGKLGQDSGERDFKGKHAIKKVGVKADLDGTVFTKEETDLTEEVDEESERQEKYKKVFNAALKKFGVKGIGELEGDKKKEFFDYIDKNYDAKDEEVEESVEEATLSVSAYTGNMKPAKIKLKKGKSNSFGGHDVTAVGSEKDLIAWAVRSLGVVKPKNFRDAQKQIDDMS